MLQGQTMRADLVDDDGRERVLRKGNGAHPGDARGPSPTTRWSA